METPGLRDVAGVLRHSSQVTVETLGLAGGHPIRQPMLHIATNVVAGVLRCSQETVETPDREE